MKTNRYQSLRALTCALLALPVLGLSLPSAVGFWNTHVEAQTTAANGHAPVAADVEGQTFAGVYVELPLSATDADGDAVIFKIVEAPRLGTASISEGTLQYTPKEGKTGTDKFTYAAVDTLGNLSEPAQVKVKIKKNAAKLTYADMERDSAHYAALCLADHGVLTGEKIGASYFFHPNDEVTRSEFIAMAAAAADLPVEPTLQTDFADDAGLSSWAKPYISAAASTGLVSGYRTAAGVSEIRGESAITAAEASVIVSNLLTEDFDAPVTTSASEDSAVPTWAATATARLTAASVLPDDAKDPGQKITRKTACEMLYSAMQLRDA